MGYELTKKGLVFGGDVLTTTDVIVAAGAEGIGDAARVASLSRGTVGRVLDRIEEMINISVERMKTSAESVPVIAVGGGSILIVRPISGATNCPDAGEFRLCECDRGGYRSGRRGG